MTNASSPHPNSLSTPPPDVGASAPLAQDFTAKEKVDILLELSKELRGQILTYESRLNQTVVTCCTLLILIPAFVATQNAGLTTLLRIAIVTFSIAFTASACVYVRNTEAHIRFLYNTLLRIEHCIGFHQPALFISPAYLATISRSAAGPLGMTPNIFPSASPAEEWRKSEVFPYILTIVLACFGACMFMATGVSKDGGSRREYAERNHRKGDEPAPRGTERGVPSHPSK